MTITIEINKEVYNRLSNHAQGFDITPNDIIKKLLDSYEHKYEKINNKGISGVNTRKQKFSFNNIKSLKKNQLVLEVVKFHIEQNPNITYEQLKQDFPNKLQGSYGVILNKASLDIKFKNKKSDPNKRFKQIPYEDIYVCSQWGEGNFPKFVEHIRKYFDYIVIEE